MRTGFDSALQRTLQRLIGLRLWSGLLYSSLALVAGRTPEALAKEVELSWKSVKHSVRYEIQIEQSDELILKKQLQSNSWKGDLPYGIYAYQIRAWDETERPGQWSEPRPLVVMGDPAIPLQPFEERKKLFYKPTTQSILRWEAVPGATAYKVEVKSGEETIYYDLVKNTELRLESLREGRYVWTVTAVVEAQVDRAPASFLGRRWEGLPCEQAEFTLRHESLPAPTPLFPLSTFKPPKDGLIQLKWSPVPGAEAYEVILSRQLKGGTLANPVILSSKPIITKDNFQNFKVSKEGQYTWQVRAIASISTPKDPDSLGIKSVSEFVLDRNAIYAPHSGYVAFRALYAPYTYQVSGPQTGGNPLHTASASSTTGLSGEYWPTRLWGVGASFNDRFFSLAGMNFSDPEFQFLAKYRMALNSAENPWAFFPEAGIEARQYSFVVPSFTGKGILNSQSWMSLGPVVGFDLRKQLRSHLSLGAKILYYLPALGGQATNNLSAGLQGFYWINEHWAAGAGLFAEGRSLKKTDSSLNVEQVQMNGSYFYGSLIWSFTK